MAFIRDVFIANEIIYVEDSHTVCSGISAELKIFEVETLSKILIFWPRYLQTFDTIKSCYIKLMQGLQLKNFGWTQKWSFFVPLQKFRPRKRYDNGAMYVIYRMTDNVLHLKSANGSSSVSTLLYHESGAVWVPGFSNSQTYQTAVSHGKVGINSKQTGNWPKWWPFFHWQFCAVIYKIIDTWNLFVCCRQYSSLYYKKMINWE